MVRTRVRLMIEITDRAGAYRKGLLAAVEHLSPAAGEDPDGLRQAQAAQPERRAAHRFSRDPGDPARLVPGPWKGGDVRDTLAGLLA